MSPLAVNAVKSSHVARKQRLHDASRGCLVNLQQQVEMIGHQDVGVEVKWITPSHSRQRFQESLVVALLEKYLLPVLAARRDMVEQSSGVNPGMAWHGRNLAEIINQGKSDTVETP
jgi:hypothetical protein